MVLSRSPRCLSSSEENRDYFGVETNFESDVKDSKSRAGRPGTLDYALESLVKCIPLPFPWRVWLDGNMGAL
jgi:hypothetical protein